MILNSPYITGSLTVTGNIIASGSITISGSIASSSYAVSASEASKLQGLGSASFAPASTFNTVSQSYALSSGSLSTRVTNEEATSSVLTSASSSFATMSGSLSTRVTIIEGQDATTGSNTFTGPQHMSDVSNAISFTSTASLYTDGGFRVAKDSYVSGTAYFNNITVYGTSSIQYITSSQVNIGSNIITVNTDTPAIRFGGLSVFDSGSTQLTGSIFWDSEKNHWIYSNPSGSSYNSGMIMSGPRNSGSLGDEQGTTLNALMKGQGGDHITSSQMFDDGTTVRIPGNFQVTGSTILSNAAFTGSVNITGSLTVTTTAPELQVGATGVTLGNIITDNHNVTGSLRVSGSFGLNKAVPQRQYTQVANTNGIVFTIQNANASNEGYIIGFDSIGSTYLQLSDSTNTARVYLNSSGSSYIDSGNVGIGTTNPVGKLNIWPANNSVAVLRGNSGVSTSVPAFEFFSHNSSGTQGGLAINTFDTTSQERLRITYDGLVGIGTSSPSYKLQVGDLANTSAVYNDIFVTGDRVNNDGYYARLIFGNSSQSGGSTASIRGERKTSNFGTELTFYTNTFGSAGNGTERMRITSEGAVGIGTTDPSGTRLRVEGGELRVTTTNLGVALYRSANTGEIAAYNWDGAAWVPLGYAAQSHIWKNSGTEGMRLTTVNPNNMACLSVGDSSPGGSYAINAKSGNGAFAAKATGGGDANYYSTSNTIGYHIYADRGAGAVFYVATNGDVRNANNSYGSTSDIKLKENITDASPKLEDLLKVKIRNYNFISDETKTKQIGVIAQELEEIFPNMVSEEKQMTSEETVKTVKYSVFVPMLIKAIQEQQAQIEELTQKVNTLENK
jgi:hypothetical protein